MHVGVETKALEYIGRADKISDATVNLADKIYLLISEYHRCASIENATYYADSLLRNSNESRSARL